MSHECFIMNKTIELNYNYGTVPHIKEHQQSAVKKKLTTTGNNAICKF